MEQVNHPQHYQSVSKTGRLVLKTLGLDDQLFDLECIAAIEWLEAQGANFCYLNAVKYLWRCGLKQDAAIDLEKAQWYLRRLTVNPLPLRVAAIMPKIEAAIEEIECLLQGGLIG